MFRLVGGAEVCSGPVGARRIDALAAAACAAALARSAFVVMAAVEGRRSASCVAFATIRLCLLFVEEATVLREK